MTTTKLLLLLLFGGGVVVTSSCILSRTFEKQKWIGGTYLGPGPFGHVFVHYGGSSMAQVFPKTPREQSFSNYK
jgi:hypothetical protein